MYSFNKPYKIDDSGTLTSIPNIPKQLPPIVTAIIVQIAGSPTEFPTTLG